MSPPIKNSIKPSVKVKMGQKSSKKSKDSAHHCESLSSCSTGDEIRDSKGGNKYNENTSPVAPGDDIISALAGSDDSSTESYSAYLLSEDESEGEELSIFSQLSLQQSPDDDSTSGESCAASISESSCEREVENPSAEFFDGNSASDSEASILPGESIILMKKENAVESVLKDLTRLPQPPVLSFYVPRETIPPKTRNAIKQSLTPFQRINRTSKSKLASNIIAKETISQLKHLQREWNSINNLTKIDHWKALKNLRQPFLISLKLLELKHSFVKVVSQVSDFDSCSALFYVLGEVSSSQFEYHKTEVMMAVANPHFMKTLLSVVESFHTHRPKKPELMNFVANLVEIYGDIFLQLDSLVTDGLAMDLTKVIESCLKFSSTLTEESYCDERLNQLLSIVSSRDSLIRANSCFPYDILREESIEVNIIDGPFENFDQYLSIHYRLLKEDFQNSLREGIVKYLQTLFGHRRRAINYHLTIYPNVTLVCDLTKYVVKYKIIFHDPTVIRRLQDPATRAFLSGSLLILTPCISASNPRPFEEYYLVRVEDSSPLEREKSYIFVSIILGPQNPTDSINVLMAEPSQLFEPYYRVMNMIRSLDTNNFPFIRYIVEVKTDVLPPAYMTPTSKLRIGHSECLLWEDESWPNPEDVELNRAQLEGLKLALRSELAIIQGPPGTGKTYLSRKIVEVLLQNKALWHKRNDGGAGLIMVVCFKNQSLDQLLGGLVEAGKKVLRVGKNSRLETLDEYNLHTLRNPKHSDIYYQMRRELGEEQKDLICELSDSIEVIRTINDLQGLVKLDVLTNYIHLSEENLNYLESNYDKWLIDIPHALFDFDKIEKILRENEYEEDFIEGEQIPNWYHVSLQDIDNELFKLNSKLDNIKYVGAVEYINDLTDAVAYLVRKLDFLKYKLSELNQPLTCDVHMKMMHLKITFKSPERQPPIEGLPLENRWLLYKAWVDDLYQFHSNQISSLTKKSRDQFLRFIEIEEILNVRKIVQCDAEVIGMTTTAAAKYYKMLDYLKPKIVLVEEAAEVIEAHTIASLSKHCEHLILVGDHKQLRPLTSSHLIGKDAHLDISMYERLVRNGFPHCTLNMQYRMRPEIASLIAPAVYANLVNDSSVSELPHVLGVCADLYFVDHKIEEDETPHIVSKWNKYEAEFLLALCYYLVRQGYQTDQITVLATYSEQEKYFNKEKLNYPELEDVLMATVDSFQGKENDIILLSLVRSNAEGNIGFLSQRNRINVALSRAKRGLFITGNSTSLLRKGGLWHEVVDVLSQNNAIGSSLPLKCQIHGKVTRVKTPKDLRFLKNGGCSIICQTKLACGHNCLHRCHPTDRNHDDVFKCSNICGKRMDCSHFCIIECHIYNNVIKCFCESCSPKTICDFKFPCGHTCKSMGHAEDIEHKDKFRCNEICNTVLRCGHTCCSLCHTEDIGHQKRYKCPIICEGKLFCGHHCQKQLYNKKHVCSDHKIRCRVVCATVMPCGHIDRRLCHIQDRINETVPECPRCGKRSAKAQRRKGGFSNPELKNDGKKNQQHKKCIHGKEINSCDKVCGYKLGCGHQCNEKCHTNEDSHKKQCAEKCGAILPCGHLCQKTCHILTSPLHERTDILLCQTCAKGQTGECSQGLVSTCKNNCDFEYKCGNLSTKKCNPSDVTHSKPCKQLCGQLLECLHPCKKSCHFEDSSQHGTPCEQQCGFLHQCGHYCEKSCHYSEHPYNHLSSRCEECSNHDVHPTLNIKGQPSSLSKNKCDFKFKCGHSCGKKRRHSTNVTHSKPCKQKCSQLLDCGHSCKLLCHFEDPSKHGVPSRCRACTKNEELSEVILETPNANVTETYNIEGSSGQCVHGLSLVLYCKETCDFKYPCGHSCLKKCRHVADATHSKMCKKECHHLLTCGHLCKSLCHWKASTQHTNGDCRTCRKTMCQVYLHCGHRCSRTKHLKDNIHECSTCSLIAEEESLVRLNDYLQ